MATTKKSAPKFGTAEWRKLHPRKPQEPTNKFVTEERFAQLESSMGAILDLLEKQAQKPVEPAPAAAAGLTPATPVETPAEASVRKAGANQIPMNPEWEERAREIIGEAVDHCEIQYLKNGGVIFTVVIKKEMSNERTDYLNYYGSDRRSKEIGAEGIEGVDNWCKLIKSNLARPKPLSDR